MRSVGGDLVSALGGDLTPQQRILVDRIVYKLARCTLFECATLTTQSEPADEHYLAWANSLRHDLALLGLQRVAKDLPSLQTYLAEREAGGTGVK
jgi:hypothetical protein